MDDLELDLVLTSANHLGNGVAKSLQRDLALQPFVTTVSFRANPAPLVALHRIGFLPSAGPLHLGPITGDGLSAKMGRLRQTCGPTSGHSVQKARGGSQESRKQPE